MLFFLSQESLPFGVFIKDGCSRTEPLLKRGPLWICLKLLLILPVCTLEGEEMIQNPLLCNLNCFGCSPEQKKKIRIKGMTMRQSSFLALFTSWRHIGTVC